MAGKYCVVWCSLVRAKSLRRKIHPTVIEPLEFFRRTLLGPACKPNVHNSKKPNVHKFFGPACKVLAVVVLLMDTSTSSTMETDQEKQGKHQDITAKTDHSTELLSTNEMVALIDAVHEEQESAVPASDDPSQKEVEQRVGATRRRPEKNRTNVKVILLTVGSLFLVAATVVLAILLTQGPFKRCKESTECDGGSCALSSLQNGAKKICCPGGSSINAVSLQDGAIHQVCSMMPGGTFCKDGGTCSSRKCVDGKCSSSALCTSNVECFTEICTFGSAADDDSSKICCPRGSTYVYAQDRRVCQEMPVGTSCGESDSICASGRCRDGYCTAPLDVGEKCTRSGDCLSSACGKAYVDIADREAPKVCCSHGTTNGYIRDENGNRERIEVCSGAPIGTACSEIDSMCSSGNCINGSCALDRLDDYEQCSKHTDCRKNACAHTIADFATPKVCCESGYASGIVRDGDNGETKDSFVCQNAQLGSYCNQIDSMCASGLCINGTCAEEALDEEEECSKPSDCINNACGHSVADTEAPKVCCRSGQSTYEYLLDGTSESYSPVCRDLPLNTFCYKHHNICASRVCIGGSCVESRLDDFAPCRSDFECSGSACSLAFANTSAPNICCPEGQTTHTSVLDHESYYGTKSRYTCGNMPPGTFCHQSNDICASGLCFNGTCVAEKFDDSTECVESEHCKSGACGRPAADSIAPKVCCSSGGTVRGEIRSESGVQSDEHVCTEMTVGTFCNGIDAMCASGQCVNTTCTIEPLKANEVCHLASDCLNGACALPFADAVATTVCCESGQTMEALVQDGMLTKSMEVCTNLPAGTFCQELDEMCASGSCTNGTCAPVQRPECRDASDCTSRACGHSFADTEAPMECCSSGKTIYGKVLGARAAYVCSQAAAGTFCGELDSMCQSGLCINSTCADEKREEYETCTEDDDCALGACALGEANFYSSLICCPNGDTTSGLVQNSTESTVVCSNMRAGTYCNDIESMCASGFCVNGKCAEQGLADLEPCVEAEDCLRGVCNRGGADFDAPRICCPKGLTTLGEVTYQATNGTTYAEVCAGMGAGTMCRAIDSMCENGRCVNGTCLGNR